MTENNDMKSDTTLTWNWLRMNVPTLIAIGGMVWYMAANDATMLSRVNTIEQSRAERAKEADAKFSSLNASMAGLTQKIGPLENITYRVGIVEGQGIETNKRIDRLSELIVNSLDLIRRDVNGLTTEVKVLSQKIDSAGAASDKRRADMDERNGGALRFPPQPLQ